MKLIGIDKMIVVPAEVKESTLHKKGVFAKEKIKKGEVVVIFGEQSDLWTEEEYIKKETENLKNKKNEDDMLTPIRWVGKYFCFSPKIEPEDYINHSFDPNLLYHCAMAFAAKDIEPGEELKYDYRFVLMPNDPHSFVDKETGKKVDGLNADEVLLKSTEKLLELLKSK